jgi:hypothetical protein
MYDAHVNEKYPRTRQKEIMNGVILPVSDGLENSITPSQECISQHINWSSDEEIRDISTSGWAPWDEYLALSHFGVLMPKGEVCCI